MKHVVLMECRVCGAGIDRKLKLAELQRAITQVDEAIIRPAGGGRRGVKSRRGVGGREVGGAVMTAVEREERRGADWASQIRAARRAVTKAMLGKEVEEEDWRAVQRLLGGVLYAWLAQLPGL